MKCCRACLSKDSLNPIFLDPNKSQNYSDILSTCTGLKVFPNDSLPQVMCTHCINLINMHLAFRNTCRESYTILVNTLKKQYNKRQCDIIKHQNNNDRTMITNDDIKGINDSINNDTDVLTTFTIDNVNDADILTNDNVSYDNDIDINDNSKVINDNFNDIIRVKDDSVYNCTSVLTNDSTSNYNDKERNYDNTVINDSFNSDSVNNDTTDNREINDNDIIINDSGYNVYKMSIKEVLSRGLDVTFTNVKRFKREKLSYSDVKELKRIEKATGTSKCKLCQKVFGSKIALNNHLKTHLKLNVVCEHCGKKFINRRRLLMHCKAKHGYEKTDKCSYCEYRGCNAELVKIHERLHTGERPYACKDCGARFHRRSSFLQHTPIHLPEKTVQCDECPSLFKSVTLMRIHKYRHKKRVGPHRSSVRAPLDRG